jgi:acetyl-CoA carboxylase biotin carboxyl carrier protein
MSALDLELVRHALQVARDHGFAEVELGLDSSSFSAKIQPNEKRKVAAKQVNTTQADGNSISANEKVHKIKAPCVGYFQSGKILLKEGQKVSKGDVVGSIAALGIANDVDCRVSGEIIQAFISEGEPVEYGQVLAEVSA